MGLRELDGAYAIGMAGEAAPGRLTAARKGSPLVIGVGENEFFFASDATPIIEYTKNVVYLDDFEIAVVDQNKLRIVDADNTEKLPAIQKIEMELEADRKSVV